MAAGWPHGVADLSSSALNPLSWKQTHILLLIMVFLFDFFYLILELVRFSLEKFASGVGINLSFQI